MKIIDKTNKSKEWDYGTVLKCWNTNPDHFDLYRIAAAHSWKNDDKYELDLLHDRNNVEDTIWNQDCEKSVDAIQKELKGSYDHIVPVKATIIIEDL